MIRSYPLINPVINSAMHVSWWDAARWPVGHINRCWFSSSSSSTNLTSSEERCGQLLSRNGMDHSARVRVCTPKNRRSMIRSNVLLPSQTGERHRKSPFLKKKDERMRETTGRWDNGCKFVSFFFSFFYLWWSFHICSDTRRARAFPWSRRDSWKLVKTY